MKTTPAQNAITSSQRSTDMTFKHHEAQRNTIINQQRLRPSHNIVNTTPQHHPENEYTPCLQRSKPNSFDMSSRNCAISTRHFHSECIIEAYIGYMYLHSHARVLHSGCCRQAPTKCYRSASCWYLFIMSEGVVRLDTYTSTLPFDEKTLLPSVYVSFQE